MTAVIETTIAAPVVRKRSLAAIALIAGVLLAGGFALNQAGSGSDAPSAVAESTTAYVDELVGLGLAAHRAGDTAQATAFYEQALAADPTSVYAHYNLALLAHEAGDVDTAAVEYASALETDSTYAPALHNAGMLYAEQNDAAAAIAMFERLVAVEPERADAWFRLGTLLAAEGRTDDASHALNKAVALDPSLRPTTTN